MNNQLNNININYIGDSHSVLTFGQTILPELEKVASVHFLAFSGMKLQYLTEWWQQEHEIQISNFEKQPGQEKVHSKESSILGQSFQFHTGDFLIIALGTNDIVECVGNGGDFKKKIQPAIHEQLKKVAKRKVIFIEPPLLNIDKNQSIRMQLLAEVQSFGFLTVPNGGHVADQADGIHMKKEMAAKFGEYMSKELLKLILPHH